MADAVTPLFSVARNTGRTFRTAALSYLEHGGEHRYLPPGFDQAGNCPEIPDGCPTYPHISTGGVGISRAVRALLGSSAWRGGETCAAHQH